MIIRLYINSAGLCIMINYSNFLFENFYTFASRRYNIINRKTLSWTHLDNGENTHRIHDGWMKCEETSFRFNTNDVWQCTGLPESALLCHLTRSLSCSRNRKSSYFKLICGKYSLKLDYLGFFESWFCLKGCISFSSSKLGFHLSITVAMLSSILWWFWLERNARICRKAC